MARVLLPRTPMTARSLSCQQTLARSVAIRGLALHSGREARVTLRPGKAGSGIVFRRVDLAPEDGVAPEILAHVDGVSRVDHATTLSSRTEGGSVSVRTVEHLLAALAGLGIDSCVVDVDGDEVPALDGSALPWVELLRSAGTRALDATRLVRRVVKPVSVSSGASSITIHPARALRLSCSIDFEHPVIGRQAITTAVDPGSFCEALAPARTFGFLKDVDAMRAAGLARGASYDNTIVLDDERVVSGALRFADEFVRHKALDLLGDLLLTGAPLAGHVVAHRAGHALHVALGRQLLADASAWRLEPVELAREAPLPALAALATPAIGLAVAHD